MNEEIEELIEQAVVDLDYLIMSVGKIQDLMLDKNFDGFALRQLLDDLYGAEGSLIELEREVKSSGLG